MKILIGCELSGVVREAFRAKGHDVYSCDILPADDNSKFHLQGDVRNYLNDGWDMAIFHPPCTRLCNSGVQWLHKPTKKLTVEQIWQELEEGAQLFSACWNAPIPKIAVENPIMHKYAKERILNFKEASQIIQPWHFGEPFFKATCLWLKNLPKLTSTNKLTPPTKSDLTYKAWSAIHLAPESKNRAKIRSKTFQGIAEAMATQWT